MWKPLDDDLSPPWVLRRSSPVSSGEADSRRAFRSTRLPTVSPADPRSELGPRSLDPDRSFWSAFAELIRDQTSPTDFCNCFYDVRATKPELLDPRRDGDLDLLPVLNVSRPLPCGSGDTRRAALRPPWLTPVPVLPACAGLPDRDVHPNAPPPRLAPAEHSEDRRARVEGPSEGRVPGPHATISRACDRCMRFLAHADGVPLLGDLRTSVVIGAPSPAGRYPQEPADRPRPSFRRRPAKRAAFQKTGMP